MRCFSVFHIRNLRESVCRVCHLRTEQASDELRVIGACFVLHSGERLRTGQQLRGPGRELGQVQPVGAHEQRQHGVHGRRLREGSGVLPGGAEE